MIEIAALLLCLASIAATLFLRALLIKSEKETEYYKQRALTAESKYALLQHAVNNPIDNPNGYRYEES